MIIRGNQVVKAYMYNNKTNKQKLPVGKYKTPKQFFSVYWIGYSWISNLFSLFLYKNDGPENRCKWKPNNNYVKLYNILR